MPNVIRVGDPTSHGGVVLESGAPHVIVKGEAVVLVGDKCICPLAGHQNCTVLNGHSKHQVNGKSVAYEGDKTSCGAYLISTIDCFYRSE